MAEQAPVGEDFGPEHPLDEGTVDEGTVDEGPVYAAPSTVGQPGRPVPGTTDGDLAAATLARALAAASKSPSGAGGRGTAGRSSARRGSAPGSASGAGPDARDPQLVGVGVERLLADRGWSTTAQGASVTTRWAEIVGPELAEHVRVETFVPGGASDAESVGGDLVVRADSTAWATQTRLLLPTLHRRIDEVVGAGVVSRIRILGPAAPSWRTGRLRAPGRGPRDTYG